MFPPRYFPVRFFPPRYFPPAGVAPITDTLIESRMPGAELVRVRLVWQTDTGGDFDIWLNEPIDGTLHRMVAQHDDSDVANNTYDVWLYDRWGVDVLDGKASALNYGKTDPVLLAKAIGEPARSYRSMLVMGKHRLVIDTGANRTEGIIDLYYLPRLEPRLFVAGIHG